MWLYELKKLKNKENIAKVAYYFIFIDFHLHNLKDEHKVHEKNVTRSVIHVEDIEFLKIYINFNFIRIF